MKILITGAAGFLGRGIRGPFEAAGHALRLMDVVPIHSSPHETVVGDVSDYAQVEAATGGVDGVVIAHMAPRGEKDVNYKTPAMPFDINVKGTANLFHAAAACGVRRVVVISSTAAIIENPPTPTKVYDRAAPLRSKGYYGLTKALQEVIAEQFARTHEMAVACLRVGYVLDGDANVDKYGNPVREINFMDTDRRDIGEVARLCLELPDLTYDVFHVMSTAEALTRADLQYTCDRLNWKPKHDFSWLAAPGTTGT
jgi:uronate dehydrogenase